MAVTTTSQHRQTKRQNHPKIHNRTAALDHAIRIIYRVCCLAGSASLIDKIRADLDAEGIRTAMTKRDTAAVFDWLIAALSYQGISDQIAYDYMEQHGYVRWEDINQKLALGTSCPKLKSYWHFHGCRYNKLRRTCTEPDHISRCPLPTHDLRNGHLNQLAYSLYLFIRDIAESDLIGWIDQRLQAANTLAGPDRLARMRDAIIAPLRQIHGVSDKVLTMALSSLLLGAPNTMRLWHEVGASMIAIDTLVHNFLHRTGILHRFGAAHAYGSACYRAAAVLTSFKRWPNGSMRAPSIRHSRWCFRGSCSTRSGGTARRAASLCATATALTIESLATMYTVKFTIFAVELRYIVKCFEVVIK
jgi:hypothetical protein